jgi:hypothetical protein
MSPPGRPKGESRAREPRGQSNGPARCTEITLRVNE